MKATCLKIDPNDKNLVQIHFLELSDDVQILSKEGVNPLLKGLTATVKVWENILKPDFMEKYDIYLVEK